MDLLFDVQALQSPATRNRGIDRFARSLVAAMAAVRPAWRIEVVQATHLEPIDRAGLDGLPVVDFEPPLPASAANAAVSEGYYGDWLTARAPDAIVVPSFFDGHTLVPAFTGARPPLFGVLHDLIPLLFHDQYLQETSEFETYSLRFRRLLAADAVLANSEASARDLRTLAGPHVPRTVTIGGAARAEFAPYPDGELAGWRARLARKFGIGQDFILYVGGFDYRKNLVGALRAFAELPREHRDGLELVIACHLSPEQRQEVEALAGRLAVAGPLRLTGFVSDAELRALYQLCRIFFFPSLYEGLGFPVLEALACGAPVVASDVASVPEYAGPVSWLADPASPRHLALALVEALAEPRDARRAERIAYAAGFTWEKAAEAACRVIEAGPPRRAARRRRRIAWVSPMPPAASGISDYSAEILGPIAERYEVELVIDPRDPLVAPEWAARHTVLLGNEVAGRHEAHPFDAFVYQLGNSHYHVYMLDLMRRFRSLVVLHDFYLGGLVLPAVQDKQWPVSLEEELDLEGEPELARAVRADAMTEIEAINACPLNRRVLRAAGAVLVHSAWSWQRVRWLVDVPVGMAPHPTPLPLLKPGMQMRSRLGLPHDCFLVATLGFVGPPKRIPSVLRAVAALPEAVRSRTRLLVIGYAPKDILADLTGLAAALGIADRVRFVGRVPLEDFPAYARAADVCVQLRYPTRGETSGALLRDLAAGAVCVVSDHGSIAEVPDGVVVKVRTPDHEVEDLTAALVDLHAHPEKRAALREAAVNYVVRDHDVKTTADCYAAMIELLAVRREAQDAAWTERACESLEACGDATAARAVIGPWAELRAGAARAMRAARRADGTGIEGRHAPPLAAGALAEA